MRAGGIQRGLREWQILGDIVNATMNDESVIRARARSPEKLADNVAKPPATQATNGNVEGRGPDEALQRAKNRVGDDENMKMASRRRCR